MQLKIISFTFPCSFDQSMGRKIPPVNTDGVINSSPARLKAERTRLGLSQVALGQALGVNGPRRNGLARFAGTWTEEQFREFEEATAVFEEVDAELWR